MRRAAVFHQNMGHPHSPLPLFRRGTEGWPALCRNMGCPHSPRRNGGRCAEGGQPSAGVWGVPIHPAKRRQVCRGRPALCRGMEVPHSPRRNSGRRAEGWPPSVGVWGIPIHPGKTAAGVQRAASPLPGYGMSPFTPAKQRRVCRGRPALCRGMGCPHSPLFAAVGGARCKEEVNNRNAAQGEAGCTSPQKRLPLPLSLQGRTGE